jgi:ribosomal protein S27E
MRNNIENGSKRPEKRECKQMRTTEADIPCPHCHKNLPVRFDRIGPGKAVSCPSCGATLRFSGQDLGKVQQAIGQLTAQLGDASVKIKVKTVMRRPWWKFWSR